MRRPALPVVAGVALVALAVAMLVAAAPADVKVASLPDGDRLEWRRGEAPVLLVLPRSGEGWTVLAARVARGRLADLRAANARMTQPLRDVRVRVPWSIASPRLRLAAVRTLFPADRRVAAGWEHVVAAPWAEGGESWWDMAQWWLGDGARYQELRKANPELGLYPPPGTRVIIPARVLAQELRELRPEATAARPAALAVSPSPSPAAVTPGEAAQPSPAAGPPPPLPAPIEVTAQASPTAAPPLPSPTAPPPGLLEYGRDEAIYRLRAGEALYSSVVIRFTGLLVAADVNATAAVLAKRSGITDVTAIPIGYPVRIPFELLLPEYLPLDDPRRVAWEKERQELASIKRAIRAADLESIHVILDAGHGGNDSGAIHAGVWESTYAYDVMLRVKRVLEQETRATVWTLVQDPSCREPPERDVLLASRSHRLLVDPPYELTDSSIGVNLRWVLANAILARLEKQKVSPERVVFVSLHADALHPAVRGLMVYAPGRAFRPPRGPDPASFYACREAAEAGRPRFSNAYLARSEALSTQLGEAIVRAANQYSVPVHPFQPVRSSVLRSGSRWVPAVLRYSKVPTAVLIELCNLNNQEDRELLLTWRFREKLAHAIVAGLADGFRR